MRAVPYTEVTMTANTRLTVRLNASDMYMLSCAAALTGSSTAEFIRAAAKEEAVAILEKQTYVTLSKRDLAAFTAAINNTFTPNPALNAALAAARQVKTHS